MAANFGWSLLLVAVLSLFCFYLDYKNKTISRYLYFLILFAAIFTMILGKNTGTSGGEIRHPEIKDQASYLLPNRSEDHDD